MSIDALVIADVGTKSLSGSNPLRLEIQGRIATLPVVHKFLNNNGELVDPVEGENCASWTEAPKLNGIHLLNYLTRNGFDAVLIDRYYRDEALVRQALEKSPRAVAISTTFIMKKEILRALVADIRQLAPDAFIIVGGQFVYYSYMLLQRAEEPDYMIDPVKKDFVFLEVADEPEVDLYIVSPKGEELLVEALRRLIHGESLRYMPNTAVFDGKYVFGPRIDDIQGAKDVPVDWMSLPDDVFHGDVVPMQASLGCPFNCTFCNFIKNKKLTFVKPLEQVISEMRQVSRRGARYVRFVDDNFRLGRHDLNNVCARFIEEGVDVKWMTFIRASTLKRTNLDLLKRAGCIEVQIGLESAHPAILRAMNKDADPDLYAHVIRDCLAAGINCSCSFIFGFPGETTETAETTIQFIKDCAHPELEGIFVWTAFPFIVVAPSPVCESSFRQQHGLSGYWMEWEHSTMNSTIAKDWVKRAFFEIEEVGCHYPEENLDLLFDLPPRIRKEFWLRRHHMAQLSMQGKLDKEATLAGFLSVLS
jgi:anaerobic magnesium-protoporphyrin IX monomethyl ester cyclase